MGTHLLAHTKWTMVKFNNIIKGASFCGELKMKEICSCLRNFTKRIQIDNNYLMLKDHNKVQRSCQKSSDNFEPSDLYALCTMWLEKLNVYNKQEYSSMSLGIINQIFNLHE